MNKTIYVIKAFACIFVVFIHCQFPGKTGECIVAFGRFAVPYFALVTGYFSYYEDRKTSIKIAQQRFRNMIKLTIQSSIVCILLNSVATLIGGGYLELEDYEHSLENSSTIYPV